MNTNDSFPQQTNFPALKIIGNPQASGGNTVIYSIFNAYIDLPTTDYDGMSGVPYFFVVRNGQYNIQYILVHNKVKSFGAARNGLLRMGVSVPKGYRLMDGKNPYDLLMEVYHTMLRENMKPTGDADEYEYNAQMCPPEVFEQILRQYPFEPCRSVYREMKGNSPVLLLTDRVRDFMQDTQYTELVAYKEVIVSQQGLFPAKVSLPDIPRKPQYQLFVNNQQVQWPNDPWGEQSVPVSLNDFDPRCFKVTPITFSLRAIVREGKPAPVGVTVDMEQETVRCTLQLQPLTKELHLQLEGVERADEQKVLKRLLCTVNGVQKPLVGGNKVNLVGEEIIAKLSVSYTGDDYIYMSYERTADDKVKVLFKAKPKPVEKNYTVKLEGVQKKDIDQMYAKIVYNVAGVQRKLNAQTFKLTGSETFSTPSFSYTGDDYELQSQSVDGEKCVLKFAPVAKKAPSKDDLWVVLPLQCMSDEKASANVEIYPSGDDSGLRFCKELLFTQFKGYWCTKNFALPADKWEGDNKENYHLKLKTTLGSFDTDVLITQLPHEFQKPASKKRRGFVLDEGQFNKYSIVKRYRPIILIWLLIMLPIVGGFVGYGIKSVFGEEKGSSQDSTKIDSLDRNSASTEEAKQIRQVYDRLSAEDLTFAEVMALDSLVSVHPEYATSLSLDVDLIKDYKKTVETILDWKTTTKTWEYTVFKKRVNDSRLDALHKQCVACLCDVNIIVDINAVKKYYQGHPDEFQSFNDLTELLTKITPDFNTGNATPPSANGQTKEKKATKKSSKSASTTGSGSAQSSNAMIPQ